VLPSGFETTVAGIDGPTGPVDEAFPPMSVVVRLADEIDVSRGDMICRPNNAATATQDIDAQICWMDERSPLTKGKIYALKHTTRWARAKVTDVSYRVDVNTLHRDQQAGQLGLNEIGRIRLRTTSPLLVDAYQENRTTGSFILVDEATNRTVGAGMLTGSHGT
jgi:bifunctional enzyme CysN/CysC